jgi:hypothetical protein
MSVSVMKANAAGDDLFRDHLPLEATICRLQ